MKPWRRLAIAFCRGESGDIDSTGVPARVLDKERRSCEQPRVRKQPEIIPKMVEGRPAQYLADITLVASPSSRNPDTTVDKLLNQAHASWCPIRAARRWATALKENRMIFVREVMASVKARKKRRLMEAGRRPHKH